MITNTGAATAAASELIHQSVELQAIHGHHQVVIPTVEMHQLHPSLDPNTTGYILVQQAETVSVTTGSRIKSEDDPESIDEFLSATNIEDFLWYNCPKCDF